MMTVSPVFSYQYSVVSFLKLVTGYWLLVTARPEVLYV